MVHRNCVTDPLTKQWWRDYQKVCKEGNPLGLSFVEYVAQRVFATWVPSHTETTQAPWYVATCGHQHQWGKSCSEAVTA